ncbi:TolC family protein [Roseisolibacter sp. H3M3-2]|uniref:TolC family protein n=1 Tax=Roseisolibacter sp. H3M3-2 TaxID=3031323 RepID=UPI0023DC0E81|nr:TolC family protein [Roseisolibacter sp. H3M3-2]MDF1504222.1 TolC family protein [Roseisolibacter sp. H3M3-2]
MRSLLILAAALQPPAPCTPEPPCAAPTAAVAAADSTPLTLDQALARALGQSQEVRLAKAQVDLAAAQVTAARAQALPQLNGTLSYTRTYASPFNTGGGFSLPDSMRFAPDSTGSVAERLRYLEQNAGLAGLGGIGGLFGSLPLGRPNAYVAGVSGSQVLYSGGRVGAALKIADSYREAAGFEFREQVAEVALQVRRAYVRAALSQQLEAIAQAALDQALRFHEQQRLRLQAGTGSELDVLRAEVSAENLRPQLVEARNAAEVAVLDLKRLVDLPLTRPVKLTTALAAPAVVDTLGEPDPTAVAAQRASVSAAERQVEIRARQVDVARGAFLPSVSLQVNYGAQNLPGTTFGFNDTPWRRDVSAAVGVSVPLFTGFRRTAELEQARVELERSRLQLGQLKEGVQVQYQQARGERQRALSSIAARQRTVDQAQRVHDLTVLRFERGLATQLEVSDARLALLQARTNVAQAIADFHIADAGVERALGAAPAVPTPAR